VLPLSVAHAEVCAEPGPEFKSVPWQQQMLAPSRVWPLTRGGGITVAVLDSGVDAAHPRLAGRVAAGFDALAGSGAANTDCLGSGTQVAGVIAGSPNNSSGFAGVAPGVTILPVRVITQRPTQGQTVSPAVLARAITYAVEQKADVIDVSVPTYIDDAAVRAAVAAALAKQIVVVAAVGDLGAVSGANPPPYPASYPGVLGVGAIDENGVRLQSSQYGRFVDLVAPGAAVWTLQRGGGMVAVDGTGVASGFVSATAALVRARGGTNVIQQLVATATPAGGLPIEYGRGIVNPEAAVSDHVVNTAPRSLPTVGGPSPAGASVWARSRRWALIGTGIAVGAMLVVFTVAVALPRARRRRWRATEAAAPRKRSEPDEPGPPVLLFD
jgi:subtilisin family serine protease